MLKALIKSLENKHLNPWTPGILGPSSPTKLEKNHIYILKELPDFLLCRKRNRHKLQTIAN